MSAHVTTEERLHTRIVSDRAVFGLMAEFDNATDLMHACEKARDAGFRQMDSYSPMPIHGMSEALGFEDSSVQRIVLCGGLAGAVAGFALMCYITLIAYPMNIGGKPHFSWPAFVPPTFETTILFAAFSAVFGMAIMNGFPSPYHPVFNNPRFERASQDLFFLCIESTDPKFDLAATRQFLESQHGVREVTEVEP